MKRNHFPFTLAPIVFAFFIMGYVDLIGISTNYMKKDFALSDTEANAYSVMVFVWFFVLSVPTSIMMNRIGRKRTVLLSMLITLVGMVVPLVSYSKATNDEISGLMIMGVSGGAVFPIIMGLASDAIGSQVGTVIVLVCCTLYLTFLMTRIKTESAS